MYEENQPTNKKKYTYSFLVLLVVISAVSYFWIHSKKFESTDNAQIDGNIITIKSKVSSYVDEIYFEDNQKVKKGDTLIRLNTVELKARVQQALAAVANAKAGITVSNTKATASIENASASEELASSNQQTVYAAKANLIFAKEEFERSNKLLAIKAITQQDFTSSRNQLEIAQANLQQAVNKQQSSKSTAKGQRSTAQSEQAQINTSQAILAERAAELLVAQYELSQAYIIAPYSGIITKRMVQLGNFVTQGQNLCAVIDMKQLWITANIKETQLKSIHIGQQAEIEIDAYPGLHLKGTVKSFGGATGAKFSLLPADNATGNFVKIVQRIPIRIVLEMPENQNPETPIFPGLSVFVKIQTH